MEVIPKPPIYQQMHFKYHELQKMDINPGKYSSQTMRLTDPVKN